MNANQLINIVIRMVMNRGINKGIHMAANRGKDSKTMTPKERAQAQSARKNITHARRGLNVMRRFGRF